MKRLMGNHAWRIYASGTIDGEADKRLNDLIQHHKIPYGSILYLHSPGGSLAGGMKLGRAIRKAGLGTYVGRINPGSKDSLSLPGECFSACATAFLGGEYRYWMTGSKYGVHRFFWEKRTDQDADIAQMMSAAVVEYIRSMDVDTKLFSLASQAGQGEIVIPPLEVLEQLNVVNNGTKKAKWTIESITGMIYLKGEVETANGRNKFMLVCPATEPMFLYALFDAGKNAEEVMTFGAESLMLDHNPVSLKGRRIRRENDNGTINLMFTLDQELLGKIAAANTVGIALQPTTKAAIFAGFDALPFAEGAKKLSGFLQVCSRSK